MTKELASPEEASAGLFLIDQALSYAYPAALRAAAVLGVADHLVDRSKTADELAEATGTDPLQLYRVLRLLASRGVFREDEQGRFALTPPAELLRADVPLSIQLPLLRPTTFADASFSPLAMDAPIMALNMDQQVGWADRRVSDDDY